MESDQAFGALQMANFRQLAKGGASWVRSRTHCLAQSEVLASAHSPPAGNRQTVSCYPVREVRCWCFRGQACVRRQASCETRSHGRRQAFPVRFPPRPLAAPLHVSATAEIVHRQFPATGASKLHPQPRWHRTDVSEPGNRVGHHAAGGLESPDSAHFRLYRPELPSLAGQSRHGEQWFSTVVGRCEQAECLSCPCRLIDLDFPSRHSAQVRNPGTANPGFVSVIALKRAPNLQSLDRKRHFARVASLLMHPSQGTGELPTDNATLFHNGKPEHFFSQEIVPSKRSRILCQPQQHRHRMASLCRRIRSQACQ